MQKQIFKIKIYSASLVKENKAYYGSFLVSDFCFGVLKSNYPIPLQRPSEYFHIRFKMYIKYTQYYWSFMNFVFTLGYEAALSLQVCYFEHFIHGPHFNMETSRVNLHNFVTALKQWIVCACISGDSCGWYG